jgi:magnesium-transporting ATPase (P-type)
MSVEIDNGVISAQMAACSSADEVLSRLHATAAGISNEEARARIERFGPNVLPRPPRASWLLQFSKNFLHLFAILLWIGAALSWWAQMPQLAAAIVIVVFINGVFSYWQQHRAQQAVDALERLLPAMVKVRRSGEECLIESAGIALGDIVLLAEGDAVPADIRLLSATQFRVDNSALTGESRSIPLSAAPAAGNSGVLSNIAFAGTTVAAGRAEGVIIASGKKTEFGRLVDLTQEQPPRQSTLEREIERITRVITILALAMGVLFFLLGAGVAGLSTSQGFVFALGIIVANVPEGLLPTLSLALAMSVRRMARRNAIVKRLERVETLGAVTVIVTDKTGTLTENQMTVREVWTPDAQYSVSGEGYSPTGDIRCAQGNGQADLSPLLLAAALCCDARLKAPEDDTGIWHAIGDPTEAALLTLAQKGGVSDREMLPFPRIAELPFDSSRRRMTTIHANGQGILACTKGAAEEVVARCRFSSRQGKLVPFDDFQRETIVHATATMAAHGLRVLAIANRCLKHLPDEGSAARLEIDRQAVFLGLVGMKDPPRREVPAAITACRSAGIRTIMATGDHGQTAMAIGREIGLCGDDPQLCTGPELEKLSAAELALLLGDERMLFARTTPEHKLRLVEALQKRGEVVAVTGDGVNDAPALKRADIGVAMGRSGTDVARQAADMILADDNFASIVAAVEEGRAVYDNVRKFVTYIFASNIPEIVPFVAFVLCRIPLPLTVMQILAVDLGTDLVPALALGAERPEPDLMQRPPRPRSQRLFELATLLRAYGWLGLIEAVLCLAGFFAVYWLAGWRPGMPMANDGILYTTATTMSLGGIVACQVGNAFACRSSTQSIFDLGFVSNRLLLLGITVEIVVFVAMPYVPALSNMFQVRPLSLAHWCILATFAPGLLMLEELRKWIVRRWYTNHSEQTAAG